MQGGVRYCSKTGWLFPQSLSTNPKVKRPERQSPARGHCAEMLINSKFSDLVEKVFICKRNIIFTVTT